MKLQPILTKYRSFIRFNLVGILNTLVDFVVFTLLIATGLSNTLSQCLSYSAGIANSYVLNRKWTFAADSSSQPQASTPGRRAADLGQLVRFLTVNLLTLGLSLLLLHLFNGVWGLHVLVAKAISLVFTTLVNFAGSKLWVFAKPGGN
jgi:putative flippase GtrA